MCHFLGGFQHQLEARIVIVGVKVKGIFQGPPTMGPPYGKLPIPFPYL